MKSRGPRTEPWRTPRKQVYEEEIFLSHLSRKERDDKKDLNYLRAIPEMLNQDER